MKLHYPVETKVQIGLRYEADGSPAIRGWMGEVGPAASFRWNLTKSQCYLLDEHASVSRVGTVDNPFKEESREGRSF